MTPIAKWPTIKSSWMLLGFSALTIEVSALYFQYGMGLEPCIMCIYQRVAMMGIMLSGFITAIAPGMMAVRIVGYIGWGVSAVWGMMIAIEHVSIQTETDPFVFTTCEIVPKFPSWLQLHEWFPAIFEARGDCGDVNWQLLGYSMPQWMIVVFAGFVLGLVVVLGTRIIKERTL
ncbi:MAG: disulfide bond formation protein DsbB [Algicola sp.]|nr:disulfide bond formation protein DsbB [Algicola sp.]